MCPRVLYCVQKGAWRGGIGNSLPPGKSLSEKKKCYPGFTTILVIGCPYRAQSILIMVFTDHLTALMHSSKPESISVVTARCWPFAFEGLFPSYKINSAKIVIIFAVIPIHTSINFSLKAETFLKVTSLSKVPVYSRCWQAIGSSQAGGGSGCWKPNGSGLEGAPAGPGWLSSDTERALAPRPKGTVPSGWEGTLMGH